MRIFISYRREDCQPQATSIYYGLMTELDAEVFFDVDAISAGIDFEEEIRRQVDRADVVVVVIGDDWLSVRDTDGEPRIQKADDFVQMEIRLALARAIPVVPVTVENARMPTQRELPEAIAALGRRHAPKVNDESMPQDIKLLAAQLKQLVEQRPQREVEEPVPERPTLPPPKPRLLVEDDEVAAATVATATLLQQADAELHSLGKRALERDLADGLADALDEAKVEQSWTVPNWDPQPGRFDLLVTAPDGRPRVAIETKLKEGNDIYESLWDLLKLLGLATLDHVEGAYLVVGTTVRNWEKPICSAGLFATGEHSTTDLIRETGDWWEESILPNSAGRPRWAPPTVDAELVAAVPLQLRGERWELRALKVWASTTDWLVLREGRPPVEGDKPIVERTEADTVVVAAKRAYPEYLQLSAYICPVDYSIRDVARMGFYRDRAIQPELPLIRERRDSVLFTRDEAAELRATGDDSDAAVAGIIDDSLAGATVQERVEGAKYKVFLLSSHEDERTIRTRPTLHNGRSAWTQQKRYVSSDQVAKAETTADLDAAAPAVSEPDRRAGDRLDFSRARHFIESVPRGRWTSYKEVAIAAGAPKGGMAVGEWLRKAGEDIRGVWRVLRSNGEVSEGFTAKAPGVPETREEVRRTLQGEGVELDANGRAHIGQIWRAADWVGPVSRPRSAEDLEV